MPTNIRELRISESGIARVSREHVERLSRHRLRAGDIVYSRRGDIEKCALITEHEEGWLCGTGCLLVRVGGQSADARFISYALSTAETRSWLSQRAVGATMPNLNTGILREVPLSLPEVEEQRAIAATLGALDDKIESNRRAVACASRLIDACAEQFISTIDTSDVSLEEVVEFNRLTVKPYATGAIRYIDIAAVSPGHVDEVRELDWQEAPSRARRGVQDGDVIFSTVRPGRRSYAQILAPEENVVASTGFAVMTPTALLGSSRLTSIAGSKHFSDYLESVAHGSAYPAVSIKAMGKYRLEVPTQRTDAYRFEEKTMPLRRKMAQFEKESVRLAVLRDALLPDLLSGRIRATTEELTTA